MADVIFPIPLPVKADSPLPVKIEAPARIPVEVSVSPQQLYGLVLIVDGNRLFKVRYKRTVAAGDQDALMVDPDEYDANGNRPWDKFQYTIRNPSTQVGLTPGVYSVAVGRKQNGAEEAFYVNETDGTVCEIRPVERICHRITL